MLHSRCPLPSPLPACARSPRVHFAYTMPVFSACPSRWLQDQMPEEVLKRCYFFNTFFLTKLTEKEGERGWRLEHVLGVGG